jgi:cation transport ATPase
MNQSSIDEQEKAIVAQREALQQQENALNEAKEQARAADVQEKTEKRAGLLEDAADWREMAATGTDPVKNRDYLRRAKEAEAQAAQLGIELNLQEPLPVDVPKTLRSFSTNRAIQLMVGLFLFFVVLTWIFGASLLNDPENPTGQSIMANAPIRTLLSFTLTFLTFLVATFFIRVAFPQFYRLWHNRIDSERSLESLINEAPAWAVLASLLALFFMFMQVFASYYQAIFA